MSTSAPPAKTKKARGRPTGPPDERFWIKYSQNHELPLSVTSSLFIHALVLGFVGLVLAGILAGVFSQNRKPEVQVFGIVGGSGGAGGDPNGSVESSGPPDINPGAEAAKQVNQDVSPKFENKDLKLPPLPDMPLINPSAEVVRVDGMSTLSPASVNLSDAMKAAITRAAGGSKQNGPGGSGNKNAVNGGVGQGDAPGNFPGPGSGPPGSIKEARKARWTLLFSTSSPEDYLRQLRDLNAIIAVPQTDGQFLVFRDLHVRPLVGRVESGANLPKIQYSDNDQRTITGFIHLLHLKSVPPYFMAFFGDGLERELRELEMAQYPGDENNIIQTVFQFDRLGNGKFKPRVKDLRHN